MTARLVAGRIGLVAAVRAPFGVPVQDALEAIDAKRRADGRWNANAAKPGEVHFTTEKAGKPSRPGTPSALRALAACRPEAL